MSNVGSYDPNKPRSGGFNGPRTKYFGLTKKTPTVIARVLPPFKSLKDKNAIMKFWSIIWLVDANGRKRPVPSIQRKANKQIVQADPILEKANAIKLLIENAEKNGENPQIIAQMKEKVRSIEPDNKCHLNVLLPDGQIGVLKIPWTCYEHLDKKLKELGAQGLDAVGVGPTSGLYFEFKKWKDDKGKTHFSVEPATEHTRNPQTGMIGLSYKFAPIDDTIIARMEREAGDLENLYTVRTVEEQALLASLDPATISRVLMKARVEEQDAEDNSEPPEGASLQGYAAPQQTATPTPQPTMVAQPQPTPAPQPTIVAQPTPPVVQAASAAPVQPATPVQPQAPAQTPGFGSTAAIPDDVRKFLFNNGAAGQPK